MEFFVGVNGTPRKAAAEFAKFEDLGFIRDWREKLGPNPEPIQREAADLADLARDRFLADSTVGQTYITALRDIGANIARDIQCEIAGFAILKCDWFVHSQVIGLCHFRRTWCNNVVVDYLAKHPLTLGVSADPKIKGVGPALLCFLSRIAVEHSCNYVWGEATHISWEFYKELFKLDSVKDLFLVPRPNFIHCAERKLDWQSTREGNTINMEAVKELYEIEESHPPLVGNRTVMVGPKRQLVNHFLDLPRNIQDEIAYALGLLKDGDSEILEDQWCRVLFQRAHQDGKLHQLWDEVEKRHENGAPERNPFPS
jgi:hypothetical protein